MKSKIPTPIALEDLNAAGSKHLSRSEHVSSFGVASKGDDGRMFEQKQDVANLPRLAQFDELPLQAQTFAIVEYAELDDRNHVAIEIIGPQCSAGILPAVLSASRARRGGRGHPPGSRRRYSRGQPIPGRGTF